MISVQEAKELIKANIVPLEPLLLPLSKAVDHILAEDIFAKYDIPAFRQSAMDGYALKFEDHDKLLSMIGEMPAGATAELSITNGEATRIFTGGPLPDGADTVVMQEKVEIINGQLKIQDQNLKLGLNVRAKGSEAGAGQLAMVTGSLLTPAAIGFLAGLGISELSVFPMPKVSIIVTGKELQKPGNPLSFGQVYESNTFALSAALKKEGISQIELFEADDDLEILVSILNKAMEKADVVLLTGGVSVGDYDFVIAASQKCAIEQVFHKIKQKPGKPLFFGKKGRQLIFGLPGNPASVLSCFYNYVIPAVKKLSEKENSVKEVKAKLTHSYQKPAGLTHFLKGNYQLGKVTPLQAQESYRLSSFAQANCLICLKEEITNVEAGDTTTIYLLP